MVLTIINRKQKKINMDEKNKRLSEAEQRDKFAFEKLKECRKNVDPRNKKFPSFLDLLEETALHDSTD